MGSTKDSLNRISTGLQQHCGKRAKSRPRLFLGAELNEGRAFTDVLNPTGMPSKCSLSGNPMTVYCWPRITILSPSSGSMGRSTVRIHKPTTSRGTAAPSICVVNEMAGIWTSPERAMTVIGCDASDFCWKQGAEGNVKCIYYFRPSK